MIAADPRSATWTKQDWAQELFTQGDRIVDPGEFFRMDSIDVAGGDAFVVLNLNQFSDSRWSAQFRRLPNGDVICRSVHYTEGLDVLAEALRPHPGGLDVVLALIDRVIGPLAALRFAAAIRREEA